MKKTALHRIVTLLLALILCTAQTFAASNPVSETRNGTVRVMSFFDNDYFEGSGLGTAFIVSEDDGDTYLVTNRHVISEEGILCNQAYILLDDYAMTHMGFDSSHAVPCELYYVDPTFDIAILKIETTLEGREPLTLSDPTDRMDSNDKVVAVGYPRSADYVTDHEDAISGVEYFEVVASPERVTFTDGILSGFMRNNVIGNGVECIQHSAPINGGNSGGPLVDENGYVIGVNTWEIGQDGETLHSYSINISEVIDILDNEGINWQAPRAKFSWLALGLTALVVVIAAAVALILRKKAQTKAAAAPAAIPAAAAVSAAPTYAAAPAAPAKPAAPASADSGLRFQGVSGVFAGKRFSISGQIRMGRDSKANDFSFPANTKGISSQHCVLLYTDGKLYLKDVGSTYGTFLGDGQRLAAGQAVELKIGDRFYLGSTNETFVITGKGGI